MSALPPFDVVRDILDHEIVDADGVPCGMVDDVEIELDARGRATVVALLVGPGAQQARVWRGIAWLMRRAFGARRTRVAWADVAALEMRIRLARPAATVGLGATERRLGRRLAKVPGA